MAAGPKAVFSNFLTPNSVIHTYTCANGTAISKGTLLQLSDPVTAAAAGAWSAAETATNGMFIGVAFADKEANDDSTTISVLKEGRMDVRASGSITAGQTVICAGQDEVKAIPLTGGFTTSSLLYSGIVGIAEETAADQEVIIVRFNK